MAKVNRANVPTKTRPTYLFLIELLTIELLVVELLTKKKLGKQFFQKSAKTRKKKNYEKEKEVEKTWWRYLDTAIGVYRGQAIIRPVESTENQ